MATQDTTAAEVLLRVLEAHESGEQEILHEYEQAAKESPDSGVRFLMDLILEDETRHHRWISTMTNGVRHSLKPAEGPSPLPPIETNASDSSALIAQTERFLKLEREALHELRQLHKTMQWIEDEGRTLYGEQTGAVEIEKPERTAKWMRNSPADLIVEMMTADTERHIRILDLIKHRIQHQPSHKAGFLERLISARS